MSLSVVPAQDNKEKKFCDFHKSPTHNTKDCRAAAASANGTYVTKTRPNNRICRTCGALGWTPNHKCNTAAKSGQGNQFSGMALSTMTIVQDGQENNSSSSSSASSASTPSASSVSSSASGTSAELQAAYNAGLHDATNHINDLVLEDEDELMGDSQA